MDKSNLSAIAQLVPQTSYEIIGRIIPGIAVILSLVLAVMGPSQAATYWDGAVIHPDTAPSVWAVVLIGIAAYVLAFVLDGIWQIPAWILRRKKPCSIKLETVNQRLPEAGTWLTKLYAETNATRVLIIGWTISAAINLYFLVTAFPIERLWLEVGLIAGTIGAAAVRYSIDKTREERLGSLWRLLQEQDPMELAENTTEEMTLRLTRRKAE